MTFVRSGQGFGGVTYAHRYSLGIGTKVPLTRGVKTRIRSAVGPSKARLQESVSASGRGLAVAGARTRRASAQFYGFSRHGMVAAGRQVYTPTTRSGATKMLVLMLGSSLIGLGVTLFVRSGLGVPAYDVMLTALRDQLGISLGQAGWLFTGLLLAVATILRQPPKPSGIIYMFANGLAVDTFMTVISEPEPLAVRIAFVALGTLAMASAIALVLHAGLTGGSIELLMNAGEARGLNPFRVRTAIEAAVVGGGLLLGGDFGPATVVFVLVMSPVLQAGRLALADHHAGRQLRLANADR